MVYTVTKLSLIECLSYNAPTHPLARREVPVIEAELGEKEEKWEVSFLTAC